MLRSLFSIACLLIAGPACATDTAKATDLVRQLEAEAPGERVIAAERLGDLGPAAADAIPALTRAAGDAHRGSQVGNTESCRANRFLYQATINALVGIGPKSAPALVELLPLEREDFFGQIAGALKSFGRDAAPAVPALAKLLADKNQDFRVTVAGILEAIGPGAEAAVPDLIALAYTWVLGQLLSTACGSAATQPPRATACIVCRGPQKSSGIRE
jgi:HEAT repeat protein